MHYMLTLLSRGPRFYSTTIRKLGQLETRGYVVSTGTTGSDGSQEWAITDAGRNALLAYAEVDALLLGKPSIRFRERKS